MTQATNSNLGSVLARAERGPLLETQMFPYTNQGGLRVTYNWLYSALNCDPSDSSAFVWVVRKIDDTQVSLSPKDHYASMTLYASVRDDWDWHLQVQAPHSADWITAVGRDETITMESKDLLSASFKGFNGQYVAVDSQMSDHGPHDGYRLQSTGASDPKARLWFLGVTKLMQDGLEVPLKHQVSREDVVASFLANGLEPESSAVARVVKVLSGPSV